MPLTSENVAHYTDGQMEIVQTRQRTRLKGQISSIAISENVLRVDFSWLAYLNDPSGSSPVWTKVTPAPLRIDLDLRQYTQINLPGNVRHLIIPTEEIIRLLPPGVETLALSKVRG